MTEHTRLKQLREYLGYNQSEFSKLTGMVQGNLSATEQGKRAFTERLQDRILKQFNVNPVWWATGQGDIIDAVNEKTPRYLWQDLEGSVLGYENFTLFSDCTKICEYTGPDAFGIARGTTIGLRETLPARVAAGTLVVITTKEGSFLGKLAKYDTHYISMKNETSAPFQIERTHSTIYLLVGAAYRFV